MADLAQHLLDTAAEHGGRPALRTDDAAELQAWVEERVAAHEYPRHVWLVGSLPKRPTGRIVRRAVEVPVAVRA